MQTSHTKSSDISSSQTIKKEQTRGPVWDLVVIGGGPSGMMAAGRAAELGAHVLILEKNESLGKKLLITGGGRCNVTNSEFDTRVLLAKFKDGGKFLFSPFSQYGVKETLDFFHRNGMETKVENEKRTFPVSDNAGSVLEVLKKYMASGHVVIQSNAEVSGFVLDHKMDSKKVPENGANNETSASAPKVITGVKIKGNDTVFGKKFVLATGGRSRPETGSTGDGFAWAKQLGHTVVEPSASLVPLKVKDAWSKNLAGISLSEVKITILQNGVRQNKPVKGKILFTHVGVSGPTILNLSKDVGELLKYGDVFISIDVLPNIDQATLDTKLNILFRTEINKKLKNCLGLIGGVNEHDNSPVIPTALIKTVIEISGVDGETPAHSVTKEHRRKILTTLKGLTMQISGILGTDKAIVTSGGVVLTEIEPKTMQSRIHPNLYLVGDMLNIDRPSGGYSLQLCWTTGYVAGNDVGSNLKS